MLQQVGNERLEIKQQILQPNYKIGTSSRIAFFTENKAIVMTSESCQSSIEEAIENGFQTHAAASWRYPRPPPEVNYYGANVQLSSSRIQYPSHCMKMYYIGADYTDRDAAGARGICHGWSLGSAHLYPEPGQLWLLILSLITASFTHTYPQAFLPDAIIYPVTAMALNIRAR